MKIKTNGSWGSLVLVGITTVLGAMKSLYGAQAMCTAWWHDANNNNQVYFSLSVMCSSSTYSCGCDAWYESAQKAYRHEVTCTNWGLVKNRNYQDIDEQDGWCETFKTVH